MVKGLNVQSGVQVSKMQQQLAAELHTAVQRAERAEGHPSSALRAGQDSAEHHAQERQQLIGEVSELQSAPEVLQCNQVWPASCYAACFECATESWPTVCPLSMAFIRQTGAGTYMHALRLPCPESSTCFVCDGWQTACLIHQ